MIKTTEIYSFDLTALSVQSLEKLEELYLYVIDQQKQIHRKTKELDELKKSNEILRKSQAEMNDRLLKLEAILSNKAVKE